MLLQLVPDLTGAEREAAIEAAHEATMQIAHFAQLVLCARALAELLPGDEGERLGRDGARPGARRSPRRLRRAPRAGAGCPARRRPGRGVRRGDRE